MSSNKTLKKQAAARAIETVLVASVALSIAPLSLAGSAQIQSGGDGITTFEYNDSMLRIGMGTASSYAVVRDGTIYAVTVENGQTMVIDAGSVMRGFASTAAAMAPSDLDAEVLSMEKTGRRETVAGIAGEVYEVRIRDENGQERSEEIVLSTDKRAREFRDALFHMMEFATSLAPDKAADDTRDMQKRLAALNAGVLRYGQEMVVTSIDDKAIDPSRFELPAKPMNLEGLGSMLGAMGQNTSGEDAGETPAEGGGGLFSSMMGALGGKADRQADRVGQSTENEIDRETDKAVDKTIGKAFGKLFGR